MPVDFDGLVLGPLHAIFGDAAWYRPQGQQAYRINLVSFMGAKEVSAVDGDGVPISDIRPKVCINLSDLRIHGIEPDQGDRLTIDLTRIGRGQVDFQVADVDEDGEGAAVLTLNELVVPA